MTDKLISAKSRRLAREVLDMIDPDTLTINQRLTRIEKEIKRQGRLKRKKRATRTT